jgi:hypothetical protein
MSTRTSRIRIFLAAVMIAGSIAALVGGHLSAIQLVLYLFVLGLGLFTVWQAITQSGGQE